MKRLIYADNAATTKLDIDAFEAMKPYLLDEYGNASQPYSFSRTIKKALRESRNIIASCINADPEEIFFTSGGTESDNWAIKGIAFAKKRGRAIVTSSFEHHAILNSCRSLEKLGYPIEYIKPNSNGIINPHFLETISSPNPLLISIMMSNNEIGTIQPIAKLTKIAHEKGALFHTDAVQCVGHIPINVKTLDIDLLSASAHKFNGPKGIGFLYIKKGTIIEPLLNGGSQESERRAGTENVAAIVGMSVALKKNCDRMNDNTKHIIHLENMLLNELKKSGVNFFRNGKGNTIPGNISIAFPGYRGESILHRLDLMGIQISTGSACDSVNTQISHVLSAINVDKKIAESTIRISLGKENTEEDIILISAALSKIAKK